MLLELYHPELTEYKYFVNDVLISEGLCNCSVVIKINPGPDKISVWFTPWKIKPIVRIDNILVNYSLANICMYDHMLELSVPTDFFDQYHSADINSRIQSVFGNKPIDPALYDLVIGIGKSHTALIDKIRNILNIE